MSHEMWKAVPGYEGFYEASDLGRVRSVDRILDHPKNGPSRLKGKVLKQIPDSWGYVSVRLRGTSFLVHVVVLRTFVGPRPFDKEACHNNGIKTDNRLSNLRWDTHRSNCADRNQMGARNPMSAAWRERRKAANVS